MEGHKLFITVLNFVQFVEHILQEDGEIHALCYFTLFDHARFHCRMYVNSEENEKIVLLVLEVSVCCCSQCKGSWLSGSVLHQIKI
jgi:hypothetical protein